MLKDIKNQCQDLLKGGENHSKEEFSTFEGSQVKKPKIRHIKTKTLNIENLKTEEGGSNKKSAKKL